jgi:predicted O-linked N-acetylglucosamine transferase (SPINDLY family)
VGESSDLLGQLATIENAGAKVDYSNIHSAHSAAVALLRRGDYAAVRRICRAILETNPLHSATLNLLAISEMEIGNNDGAIELLNRAIAANSRDAFAYNNLCNVYLKLRRLSEALENCQKALSLKPEFPEALFNQGNILSDLEHQQAALLSYAKALELRPGYVEAHLNRGVTLAKLGRLKDACAAYEAALRLDPENAIALGNRANVYLQLDNIDQALSDCERALALRVDDPLILLVRGQILRKIGRNHDALDAFNHVLRINPDERIAVANRAAILYNLQRYEASAADFSRLAACGGIVGRDVGYFLYCKMQCGDWQSLAPMIAWIVDSIGRGQRAIDPLPFLAISDDPMLHRECARQYVEDYAPIHRPLVTTQRQGRRSRVRIAYLSSYFYDQATTRLAAGLFECHDRSLFRIMGVSTGPRRMDAMRVRLENAFDEFVDVEGKTDDEVAECILHSGVDILVGLLGFNRGSRMQILARRPAPIQVNFLVFPGTLGANYIDYIIADRRVIDPEDERYYSEKIVYMPDSYQVNDAKRSMADTALTREHFGLTEGKFVFCCFNGAWKITPAVFEIWMRLLCQISDSVLWLHEGHAPDAVKRNLRQEAALRGVAPERLLFAPWMTPGELYSAYGAADLFLDTFPHNAHTTASDALWAGLPVLTCRGRAFAGRVAASLLGAVGLPDMITSDLREYETRAIELAHDRRRLAKIRCRLEASRRTHALFDTSTYCRNLETAYQRMWDRHSRGQPPESFHVSDL